VGEPGGQEIAHFFSAYLSSHQINNIMITAANILVKTAISGALVRVCARVMKYNIV